MEKVIVIIKYRIRNIDSYREYEISIVIVNTMFQQLSLSIEFSIVIDKYRNSVH